eukprot:6203961-Pleurochrysis_carterae.AAC.2
MVHHERLSVEETSFELCSADAAYLGAGGSTVRVSCDSKLNPTLLNISRMSYVQRNDQRARQLYDSGRADEISKAAGSSFVRDELQQLLYSTGRGEGRFRAEPPERKHGRSTLTEGCSSSVQMSGSCSPLIASISAVRPNCEEDNDAAGHASDWDSRASLSATPTPQCA